MTMTKMTMTKMTMTMMMRMLSRLIRDDRKARKRVQLEVTRLLLTRMMSVRLTMMMAMAITMMMRRIRRMLRRMSTWSNS